jgi:cardiolipin synthase
MRVPESAFRNMRGLRSCFAPLLPISGVMVLYLLLGIWVLGWCCIPHLLLLNKRPTATLAWLWAILLFPVLGPGFYLMIGTERVKRRQMKRRKDFRGKTKWVGARSDAAASSARKVQEELDPNDRILLKKLAAITQLPVATVSSIQILRKAPPFYEALRADIQKAQRDVHIQSYIWRDDEVGKKFLDLLIGTVQRGVAVRVMIDEVGSLRLRRDYFQPLIAAGGEFSWVNTILPLKGRYSFNLRNHRKLQVIDGRIAYVGGMNFGREYMGLDATDGDWSDLQVRVGGSVVPMFQQLFAEDWFFATGRDDVPHTATDENGHEEKIFAQILRGGPDEQDHPMLRVNLALVAEAKKRLWISTGYFVPGETIQTTLQVAAASGVDVRLLVSEKSEHPLLVKAGRSYYDALLRQGIRIFEYDKGIEHSKYMIIDDHWASVGSSNLDERSMRLNFELSLLMLHKKTNHDLAKLFESVLEKSREIDRKQFAKRPLSEKLFESAMRPFSPLL